MLELMAVKPTIKTPKEFFIHYHDLVDEVKTQLDPSWSKTENKRTGELKQLKDQRHNKHSKLRELVSVHQ